MFLVGGSDSEMAAKPDDAVHDIVSTFCKHVSTRMLMTKSKDYYN